MKNLYVRCERDLPKHLHSPPEVGVFAKMRAVERDVKAVQFLGNLPPRSDLASLNRKFRTTEFIEVATAAEYHPV